MRSHSSFNIVLMTCKLCFLFFPIPCSEALASLKSVIDKSKGMKVPAVRPLVLAAEENLHNMVVDLDKVVTKVRYYGKVRYFKKKKKHLYWQWQYVHKSNCNSSHLFRRLRVEHD